MATVINAKNPFDVDDKTIETGFGDIKYQFDRLELSGFPTIAVLNGQETMRKEWLVPLSESDLLVFVRLPAGSDDGSDALRVVLIIAVLFYTAGAGGAWLTGAGSLTGATGFAGALVAAGAAAAGGALINALLPPPQISKQESGYNNAKASPTYSIGAQGNAVRLGSTIPVIYGKMRVFPDFAAEPYYLYEGNKQTLFQTFVVGQGKYDLSEFKYGKTKFVDFPKTTTQVYLPGSLPPEKLVIRDAQINNQEILEDPVHVVTHVNTIDFTRGSKNAFKVSFEVIGEGTIEGQVISINQDSTQNRLQTFSQSFKESTTKIIDIPFKHDDSTDQLFNWGWLKFVIAYVKTTNANINALISEVTLKHIIVEDNTELTRFFGSEPNLTPGTLTPFILDFRIARPDGLNPRGWRQNVPINCYTNVKHMYATLKKITELQVHIVAHRGLYYVNDDSSLTGQTVQITVYFQNPAGTTYNKVFSLTTAATLNKDATLVWTEKIAVIFDDYKVWIKRSDKPTDKRFVTDINWQGIQGVTRKVLTNNKLTYVVVKSLVTKLINQTSARRFNLIAINNTKKLDASNAWVNNKTSNPVWAAVDILRNTEYGGSLPATRFNIAELKRLATICDTQGEEFNGVFDSSSSMSSQLSAVCRCARATPLWQGGRLRIARDEDKTVASAMFTSENIVKDSLKLSYILPNENTTGVINLGYLDDTDWINKRVVVKETGATKESRIEFFGCTKAAQARKEAQYLLNCNKYRREMVSIEVAMEGYIPSFGDLIVISHELPRWGVSGEILSYDATARVITISIEIEPIVAIRYILVRNKQGTASDKIRVFDHQNKKDKLELLAPPANFRVDPEVPLFFMYGNIETIDRRIRVTSVKPKSLTRILISGVVDDKRVFQ